jgi:hypothetical protein
MDGIGGREGRRERGKEGRLVAIFLKKCSLVACLVLIVNITGSSSSQEADDLNTVKAWLGVSDNTPVDVVTKLINNGEILHGSQVSTSEVTTMSLDRRAALYRLVFIFFFCYQSQY